MTEKDNGSELKKAMADAMRSVEDREAETEERPQKQASEAVTESLLKAKEELQEVLKQTQTEAQAMKDRWHRAAADLDNYRKRAQKEREDVVKFGNERLLKDFLPIVDDLDRVVASASTTAIVDPQAQALIDGVRLVVKKFLGQLEKHGVTAFEAEGKTFDPNLHEAVQQVASDKPVGSVVNQLQRGFMISERLLRPALVTVSLGGGKAS